MAASLALVAAFLFALAATLQQKGALNLPSISLGDPKSLLRLAGETVWLLGTLALLCGYCFQAAALDRGRLDVIQPLLVATVVFALPLGYWLLFAGRGGNATTKAAVYGSVAGILFGLSAALTKPTIELLHDGVGGVLSHWELYALAIAGGLGLVLQQVSLGTGKLGLALAGAVAISLAGDRDAEPALVAPAGAT